MLRELIMNLLYVALIFYSIILEVCYNKCNW